jgi:hypothetical protein
MGIAHRQVLGYALMILLAYDWCSWVQHIDRWEWNLCIHKDGNKKEISKKENKKSNTRLS